MKGNYSKTQLDEASRWVILHEEGLTEKQKRAFEDWLKADPENESCFFEHQMAWSSFDSMSTWKPQYSKNPNPDLFDEPKRGNLRQWLPYMSLAAILALCFTFINAFNLNNRSNSSEDNLLSVASEKYFLEDGSSFYLKSGSEFSVSYTSEQRTVFLGTGEAIFTVAHDSLRPFVVSAGNSRVTALGTVFSVRSGFEHLEVYVTEGRVRVDNNTETQSADPDENIIVPELVAGEKLTLDNNLTEAPLIQKFARQEYDKQTLWKDNLIDMVSAPLSEIISEFNKHNERKIIINDTDINSIRMSVSVKPDNQVEFLELLEATLGIHTDIQESGDYVLSFH